MRATLGLLLALSLAGPGAAATPAESMAAAAALVASAGQALAAARGDGDDVAALSAAIGAYQAALDQLRGVAAAAAARERALSQDLADRRDQIERLLAAMEAMSLAQPPAPALHPEGPLGAARATAMIEHLTPALRGEGAALAQQVRDIGAAGELRREGEKDLAAGLATLGAARADLEAALAAAAPPEPPRPPDDPALAAMVRDSETLTELCAALAAAAGASPPGAATAPLRWPLAGTVLRHFDEADAAGVKRPGILVTAAPLALVTAPADAIVRYAGPFLEYGYVVVLETDKTTLVVLAGLARLQVRTGDAVHGGVVLGMMGGRTPDMQEYLTVPDAGTASGADETLYVEIRQGQGPVDPEPLLQGENG